MGVLVILGGETPGEVHPSRNFGFFSGENHLDVGSSGMLVPPEFWFLAS